MTTSNIQNVSVAGKKSINIAVGQVFATLQNRAILKTLIPGCRYIEKKEYQKTVSGISINLGGREFLFVNQTDNNNNNNMVKAPFNINTTVHGNGGPAGRFKVNIKILLYPNGNITDFSYALEVTLYPKTIVFNEALIRMTIVQIIGQFFNNLEKVFKSESKNEFKIGLYFQIKRKVANFFIKIMQHPKPRF